jgi:DNA-binding transcriptional ArsR family regulator
MANEHRLLILCHLVAEGEMSVNALAAAVDLSQSALSQHLARLREDGLVAFRRESQTLFYRVTDQKAVQVLKTLKRIFCP